MAKELVIRINGDVSDYAEALKMAGEETEALDQKLNQVIVASAAAFAAFTAEVYLSVKAFNVQAVALEEVNNALQNQGIYTDELAASYRKVAEEIEKKTGVDSDAISSAQASAQALIGQTKITDDLTRAVVDFAARQKIDVTSAFNLVGKAAAGNVGALGRYGIEIDATGTKQERLAQITEALSGKYGGAAEAIAKSSGSTVLLSAAAGNLQKAIGERLAPAFDKVVGFAVKFINAISESKALTDFIVSAGVAVGVVSGLTLTLGLAAKGWTLYRNAMLAAQLATNATTLAIRTLIGATGLGLVVLVLTEIYLNWSTAWPRMQAIFQGFVTTVTQAAQGLGQILFAIFSPGPDSLKRIQDGAKQVVEAFKNGYAEAFKDIPPPPLPAAGTQDPGKAAEAGKRAALEQAEAAKQAELKKTNLELLRLEDEKASQERIDLKKKEIEILKALENEKDAGTIEIQRARLEENRRLQDEAQAAEVERRAILREELLAENEAFQQLTEEQQQDFLNRNQQKLEQDIATKRQAKDKAIIEELNQQKAANEKFLAEQQKYGTAYANINRAMNSAIYQGSKTAFGELAALQESSNNTLKGIGKTAAIANIVIKTAESAMNIYAGFSTIPIIGPALGIAGAAAAIAFGAEQVGKVRGAAVGGVVTGGVRGKDSVPFMLSPGELIAPEKNFNEVIGSVRAAREAENFLPKGGGADNSQMLAALESIDAKLSGQGQTSIVVQGDVLSDDTYIEKLAQKLSDGLEFGNLKIFGVNT